LYSKKAITLSLKFSFGQYLSSNSNLAGKVFFTALAFTYCHQIVKRSAVLPFSTGTDAIRNAISFFPLIIFCKDTDYFRNSNIVFERIRQIGVFVLF
jgi:hypothetical protein